MDIDEWPNSNKFWLYNLCCNDYDKLVKRMKAHSELEGWSVKDLGNVPMDFVATDRAIYDHLCRLSDANELNLNTTSPSHFFSKQRPIKCLASWVSAMKARYEDDEEEW